MRLRKQAGTGRGRGNRDRARTSERVQSRAPASKHIACACGQPSVPMLSSPPKLPPPPKQSVSPSPRKPKLDSPQTFRAPCTLVPISSKPEVPKLSHSPGFSAAKSSQLLAETQPTPGGGGGGLEAAAHAEDTKSVPPGTFCSNGSCAQAPAVSSALDPGISRPRESDTPEHVLGQVWSGPHPTTPTTHPLEPSAALEGLAHGQAGVGSRRARGSRGRAARAGPRTPRCTR